ncbi:MAG: TfoX/Sxy family protein [Muribaculaceae bacterium]|nr:TfoX/Sxy family protein [Muribaculaceae bacterium]
MACSSEFIDYVCEILSPLGEVRSRKMMGDYVIYLDEKCIITACDNILYIKQLPCIQELMANSETGKPYEGAKEHYILDYTDQNHARKVISVLWEYLPFPKKKSKKSTREKQ